MWCAWWTGVPTVEDFRPPDAWGGGATSATQAHALAERTTGRRLELVDGPWAGAWRRVLAGRPPFPVKAEPRAVTSTARVVAPHVVLGVSATASLVEIKAAFRQRVLAHHPDRGGDAETFIAIKRAYDALMRTHVRRRAR